MKRLLLGIAAIAALVGTPALAADLAYKALPPVPIYSWTGFYLGGNVGYSWGTASSVYSDDPLAFPPPFTSTNSGTEKLDGVIGGGQIGYNWEANQTWVLGVEADIQGSAEKGSNSFSDPYFCDACGGGTEEAVNGTLNSSIRWFGTVRGRLGVLVNPTLLLYGTGGLAYGGISTSGSFVDTAPGCSPTICTWAFNQTTTKVGWTAGGGVEGAIANSSNWTWKVEYLYINFGTLSGTGFGADPLSYSWSTKVTDNILRVGLNYRFNSGPAPAPCCVTK
jgi:outer membrane immunogenic protein